MTNQYHLHVALDKQSKVIYGLCIKLQYYVECCIASMTRKMPLWITLCRRLILITQFQRNFNHVYCISVHDGMQKNNLTSSTDALKLEHLDIDLRTHKKHRYTYKYLSCLPPPPPPPPTHTHTHTHTHKTSLPASAVEGTAVESCKTHLAGCPQRGQPWSGTSAHPRHTLEEDCGLHHQTSLTM